MDTDVIIQLVITSVILPLLVWGGSLFKAYVNEKIASMKDQRLAKALLSASEELERAANLAVNEVAETFVKALRVDGKITKEQGKEAAKLALQKTKEIMSNSGMKVIENAGKDIKSYINSLIEENVVFNKPESTMDCK